MIATDGGNLRPFNSISTENPRATSLDYPSPWRNAQVLSFGILLLSIVIMLSHETPGNVSKYAAIEMGEGVEDRAAFESDVNTAPLIRKVGFAALIALGCFTLVTPQTGLAVANYPLLASAGSLAFWTYASYTWSQFPRETLLELIRLSGWMLLALGIARKYKANEIAAIMFIVVAGSVAYAVAADVLTGEFRPWRSTYRMAGTVHPNGLADHAVLMSVIAMFFFIKGEKRQYGWLAIIAIGFAVVALTKSRNGLMCFFVGIYVLSIIGQPIGGLLKAVAFSLLVAGLFVIASGVITESHKRSAVKSATMGRGADPKLGGRSELWKAVIGMTKEERFNGVGYGAFFVTKRVERLGKLLRWFPHHAHNAYLEVTATLGWVGLALSLTTTVLAFLECLNRIRLDQDLAFQLFATMIILGSFQSFLCVAYIHARGLLAFSAVIVFSSTFIASKVVEKRQHSNASILI